MALEDLCGFSKTRSCQKNYYSPDFFHDDLISHTSNFEDHLKLAIPPFANPAGNLANFQRQGKTDGVEINFDHGTTTLGFQFQGGIILAVDSRATGGKYIGSQSVKKVVEINNYLLGTLAGGAADCIYWDRVLTKKCRMFELTNKEKISVAAASKIMSNTAYHFKNTGLSMGMMLAGYDKRGSNLYYIDSDGSRTDGKVFSIGSGSIYAYGVLDTGYNWNLTDKDAQELGRRAIFHATVRDGYSGGIIRVYHMKPDGYKNISNDDTMDLYYKIKADQTPNMAIQI